MTILNWIFIEINDFHKLSVGNPGTLTSQEQREKTIHDYSHKLDTWHFLSSYMRNKPEKLRLYSA
jgi:hypothetical protein